MVEEIIEYYNAGNSARKTAIKFGVGKSTVLDYLKSPEELKTKTKLQINNAKKKRRDTKIKAINYKGGVCQECGYHKCNSALEFHHIDPKEKDFGIGAKGCPNDWETIKIELDKCIMVCANCHREIHDGLIKI